MKKRTEINWDKHVLTESHLAEDVSIYRFKKPDTYCHSITLINACGVLSITGDWGNWILCREFHPSPKGFVSDGYWCEKIRISSTQEPRKFCPNETRKEIENILKNEDEELDEEDKEYLESLLRYVDDGEIYYLAHAHDNLPRGRDHEFVPYVKKLNFWLEAIFDAFDEMCIRKSNKKNLTPPLLTKG